MGTADGRRRSGRSLLEVAGVCGLAVTQPVLADFGAAPDWFVFHGVPTSTIVAFGLVVAVVPPVLVWAVTEMAAWGSDRRRRLAVAVAVGALVGLLVLQVADGLPGAVRAATALAAGVGAAAAHLRWAGVRLWSAWLAPAPLLFLGVFLLASPVGALIGGDDVDPAELGAFGSGEPPPVVLLIFDEWPLASIVRADGSLDAERYPNLADLAAGSTWYRDTTTVANLTTVAVPALLTGDEPDRSRPATASSYPENLFTLLGGTYELDVTERITRLCPEQLCATAGGSSSAAGATSGLGAVLDEAGDVLAERLGLVERSAPVTDAFVEPDAAVAEALGDDGSMALDDLTAPRPESLRRFLAGFEADEAPTLHALHLLNPHTPYRHLPDGRTYEADPALRLVTPEDDPDGGDRRADLAPPAAVDRHRLQLEVAHVDRLVGDVLDRLRETDLYDDALVVVTSDHGIGFRPGGAVRGLGEEPIEAADQPELLWVPLFVKAPGQTAGTTSDLPASTVDVLPTIAAHLGIDLPWTVDGLDLTGPVPADRERTFRHVVSTVFGGVDVAPPVALDATFADVADLGSDSVFADGGWWMVGPDPSAVGDRSSAAALPAELDDPEAFADVDTDGAEVPTVLAGRVAGDVDRVAVVVNGRVAAVGDTYDDGAGPGRFLVLVPPELLVDGRNEIRVTRSPP